ncbi:MAG TPA: non-heme iron oxygenase ferredoxin subunit [Candidatus Nitrosotalea sp.]|nr:non-heme iron oxygenase ferredoxin subunit [Candidatus Nitrosotalea sp.]
MTRNFKNILKVKEVLPGQMKAVEFEDETICIVNVGGKFYAINNVCTHEGGPLVEGTLDDYEVECPWHGARFDIRTGAVKTPPAESPVSTYEVKVEADNIWIRKSTK